MPKKKKPVRTLLTCPECGSDQVTLAHEQMFMANTFEHYCHSIKVQDDDSPSTCLNAECNWSGTRKKLVVKQ